MSITGEGGDNRLSARGNDSTVIESPDWSRSQAKKTKHTPEPSSSPRPPFCTPGCGAGHVDFLIWECGPVTKLLCAAVSLLVFFSERRINVVQVNFVHTV